MNEFTRIRQRAVMSSVNLNEMDLRAFVTAFNAVADVTAYTFDDETEYRMAIANLVGELRSQLGPAPREMITVTPRIPLEDQLADKYDAWNAACAGGLVCQSADSLIEEFDQCGFDRDRRPVVRRPGSVGQFRGIVMTDSLAVWN
ncbi:MAG: hypothetical protein MZU79_01175 [Anaerotruncus sp.]|nr:hypothetical protein [Anaerotruncus sp.]